MSLSQIEQKKAAMQEKLRRELGAHILEALDSPDVLEIMVNPDGALWLDTLSAGMLHTNVALPISQREMVLGTIAAYYDQVITAATPRIQAVLPLHGERFQGMRQPVCEAAFVIRKHVPRVLSLEQLKEHGTLTLQQYEILCSAMAGGKNIIIAGATMSGKTVLLDSLLYELPRMYGDTLRVVVIEDTQELHVRVKNRVTLWATETVSMRHLVHTAMRLRPDRLIIGEVRGAEALEMLKSWATGHGGSACTIHAGSPDRALRRLKTAIQEAGVPADQEFIGEVVDLIVMMCRRGSNHWAVDQIVSCEGWSNGAYQLVRLDTSGKEDSHVTHNAT